MDKKEHDNEIAKWLSGEISREQLEETESPESIDIYESITNEIDTWSLRPVDKSKGFEKLKSQTSGRETKVVSFPTRWVSAIAAAVVLLVVSYFVFTTFLASPIEQYETAYGETKEITLPDGSIVTLNTNSSLAFNQETWESSRSLDLKGEGYFKVAKGEKFTVNSTNGKVEVLGTRFNVRDRDKFLSVDCFEGIVGVSVNSSTNRLEKGMSLRYTMGSPAEIDTTHNTGEPFWITQNATKFKDAPLAEVLEAVKAQFGVTIKVENGIDLTRKFSGSFLHEDIEIALKMVCDPLDLTYRETSENTFTISK